MKRLITSVCAICIFGGVAIAASAATEVRYDPQITIPGGPTGIVNENTLGTYIGAIYNYGIGIVGIVAAVVLMAAGAMWLVAGGNTGRVQEAQEWIKAAVTGLILALLSYTILLTVNPDLIAFRPITVKPIAGTGESFKFPTGTPDAPAGGGESFAAQTTENQIRQKLQEGKKNVLAIENVAHPDLGKEGTLDIYYEAERTIFHQYYTQSGRGEIRRVEGSAETVVNVVEDVRPEIGGTLLGASGTEQEIYQRIQAFYEQYDEE